MKKSIIDKSNGYLVLITIILIVALSRVIKFHYFPNSEVLANVSPIMGIGLFGAAFFKNRILGYLIPIASMLIADFFIGFHPGIFAVYFALALIVLLGQFLLKKVELNRIIASSILGSIIFFLITNFAVWLQGYNGQLLYPNNFAGLVECYIAALPFFRNALIGDLVYTAILFGSAYYLFAKSPNVQRIQNT